MSIQKILTTDTLGNAIRSKYNETVDEIVSGNGVVESDGLVKLPKYGGGFYEIDLRPVFYPKSDVNNLVITPVATETTFGTTKRATLDDVINGVDETRFVSSAKLKNKLEDWISKDLVIGDIASSLSYGNTTSSNSFKGTTSFFNTSDTFKATFDLSLLTQNVVVKFPNKPIIDLATTENSWQLGGNTVGSEKSIGTIDNYDFPIIRNNIQVAKYVSAGVQLPTISTLSTTTSQFAVIGTNNLIQQRSLSSVAGDIASAIGELTFWRVGGNNNTTDSYLGSNNPADIIFIREGEEVFRTTSDRTIQFAAMQSVTSGITDFIINAGNTKLQKASVANVRSSLYGTGTTNYLPKRNASNQLVDSNIIDDNTNIRFLKSVIFSNGIWNKSADNFDRLYFANNSHSYYKSAGIHIFRDSADGDRFWIENNRLIQHKRTGDSSIDTLYFATDGKYWLNTVLRPTTNAYAEYFWNGSSFINTINRFTNGNVSIGQETDGGSRLNVYGTSNFQGLLNTIAFRLPTGAVTGYILQSDASGNASWVAPSTLASTYKGTWDASTNTPTLANGTGTAGWWYRCVVAGTINFGAGSITFAVGDDVYYNGSIWQRIPFSYQLVKATTSILGGVIVGSTMQVDSSGIINLGSVTQSSGSNFVKITLDGYGRVTGNTAVTASDIPTLTVSKLSDFTTSVDSAINAKVSGTLNYLPKFSGTNTIGNSIAYEGTYGTGSTPAIITTGIFNAAQGFFADTSSYLVSGEVGATTIKATRTIQGFNGTGSDGQFLKQVLHAPSGNYRSTWSSIVTTDISNLSAYTGFDARYYTEAEVDNLLTSKQNNITTTGILLGNGSSLSGLTSSTAGQILRRNLANNGYEFTTLTSSDLPSHTHTFASLTSKPTTISGYGITDFNSTFDARWNTKINAFVSFGNNVEVSQSLTVNTDLYVYQKIYDSELNEGTSGQYLSSTGIGTKWINGQDNWGQKQTHTQYDTLSDITTSTKWGAYFINGTTTDLPNSIQQGHLIKLGIGSDYSSHYTLMSFGRPFSTHFDGKLYVRGVYGASDSGWLPIGLNYTESIEGGIGLSFYGDLAQTYETARIETHTDSGVVDFVAYYLDSNNDRKKMGIRLNLNNNLPWFFNEETEFPLISEGGGGNNVSYSFDASYFSNSNNFISLSSSFINTINSKLSDGGTSSLGLKMANLSEIKWGYVSEFDYKGRLYYNNSNTSLSLQAANSDLYVSAYGTKTVFIDSTNNGTVKINTVSDSSGDTYIGKNDYTNFLYLNGRKYYFNSGLYDSASVGTKFCFKKASDGVIVIDLL